MSQLKDIVAYIIKNYPHKEELSKARLTKMVYLADWLATENRGDQLTDIVWYFNHYGPYVDSISDMAAVDPDFRREKANTFYGSEKEVISIDQSYEENLPDPDKLILDTVINETKRLYWDDFMKYVYDTPPVRHGTRFSEIDLKRYAQ